jgi:hypothetical protein
MSSVGRADRGCDEFVELTGAHWRTSSYSSNGVSCVEVASNLPGVVAVRDTKDRQGPALVFSSDEWAAFVSDIRSGEFELS